MKLWHLSLRQSYTFVLKGIYRDQRFCNLPKNRAKALKAGRHLRTIAGRRVRELKRNLKENHDYDSFLMNELPFFISPILIRRISHP